MKIRHSGPSVGFFDQRYLKLDCSNDPLTESLTLQKAGDNIHLYEDVYSSNHDRYGRLYFRKSHSSVAGTVLETETDDYLGNIKYLGVNTLNQFAGGAYMSVQQTGASGDYVPTSLELATYSSTGVNNNQLKLFSDGSIGMTGALIITPSTDGVSILDINQADGTAVLDVDTINRKVTVTSSTLQINVPTATSEALILKTIDDSGTKKILNIQTSTGTTRFNVLGSTGTITVVGSASSANLMQGRYDGKNYFPIRITAEGIINLGSGDAAGDTRIQRNTNGGFLIPSQSATIIPLTVRAAASQTANLTEWQDSGGTALAWVHPTGFIANDIFTSDGITGAMHAHLTIDDADNDARLYGLSTTIENYNRTNTRTGSDAPTAWKSRVFNRYGAATTEMNALMAVFDCRNTSVITRGYGLHVMTPSLLDTAAITNFYGVYVEDQNVAATNNYAIYTNAGAVRFGDKVMFTQTDGNEAIDSANDGYMDYYATTAHRFDSTIQTSGGKIVNTTRQTTTYTALVTDDSIFCDTDGAAWTLTLPAGVDGQRFMITNCGSSGNDLTIACNGAETLNGEATQLLTDGDSVIIIYETTEKWRAF